MKNRVDMQRDFHYISTNLNRANPYVVVDMLMSIIVKFYTANRKVVILNAICRSVLLLLY